MAGSDFTGGIGAVIWALIGLLLGALVGWYYGPLLTYASVGLVFGWLGGLLINDSDEGGDGH